MSGNPEISPGGEQAPRITFADVPFGVVRKIAHGSGYSRIIDAQDLLDLGVHEELVFPLVKSYEVPIFARQKDSPTETRDGIRGWDINQKIAEDLGIVEDPEVVIMDEMNRSAGLQQQIISFTSPPSIEERSNFSIPTSYVSNQEIDLPKLKRLDEEGGSGGVLVGSDRDLF